MILSAAQAVARDPHVAGTHYTLGRLLAGAGRYREAERCLVRCLKIAPELADAHHDLGLVLRAQGRLDAALASYTAVIRLNPGHLQAWINTGLLQSTLERHELAEAAFREALAIDSGSAKAWNNLGLSLQAQGRDEEAAEAFSAAAAADLCGAGAVFNLALLRERQGDFGHAAELYREALIREPMHALARGNLVELVEPVDPVVAETLAIIDSGVAAPGDQALMQYAMAKHCDQHGFYEQAWHHAVGANRLRQRIAGSFDVRAHESLIRRLKASFSREFFMQRAGWGRVDERPLFIVGMPRSGTTLLEQMLASHPQIHGAGELDHFALYGQDYPRLFDIPLPYPECMDDIGADMIDTLGRGYVEYLLRLCPDARYVSNKTPLNFLRVGLIKLMFPNALILHCCRNPRDSLLSIYFHNFAVQQTFATDIEALGRYYLGYCDIMRYWHGLFPESILDVHYSDVIDDPDASLRRVLEFLALPWDSRCLQFHSHKRRVDTPSMRQVRKPIYLRARGRWQHYEPWLKPLLEILEHGASGPC